MSKSIRILSIILIIFSFIISFYGVYATDINMNLPTSEETSNITTSEEYTNDTVSNIVENPSYTTSTSDNSEISSTVVAPSSVNSISEEGLGLTNILSILLITVGIILIFLAIAIIIRLK